MWKPIDTEFFAPRQPVSLVAIDSSDVPLIRTVLESLGCVVLLHAVGTPTDFLKVIGQGERAARFMIITGHGTDDGLYFGDYISSIDTSMLVNGSLPPAAIERHVNLPGCTVYTHACFSGTPAMAQAFLSGGLKAYLGCRTQPDATAANLFIHNFIYNLKYRNLSERDAWERAVAATDHEEINQISFFHNDGREERFGE